ncbi:MAG: hypothetical protein M3422_11420, partial [Actinomycetota bacterium]|nr:hypothetical protein [Actinomycetota bacterium]
VTVAMASVAAVALTIAEVVMVGRLVALAEEEAEWLVSLPSTQGIDVVGRADEIVSTGLGFWLTLAGLVMIVVVNGFLLLEGRARQLSPPE